EKLIIDVLVFEKKINYTKFKSVIYIYILSIYLLI
ncbi:hypothetical protein HMPREF9454_00616, partial [Megamonas funiformis YIT 11815]